jgi:thioredoxin-like negative regulator of GroEL
MMSNVLSPLSKKLEGKVSIVKIDTEKYPKLASKFNVTGEAAE